MEFQRFSNLGVCSIRSIYSQKWNDNNFTMDINCRCTLRKRGSTFKTRTLTPALSKREKPHFIWYQLNCFNKNTKNVKTRTICEDKLQISLLECSPTIMPPFDYRLQHETRRFAWLRHHQRRKERRIRQSTWTYMGRTRWNKIL